MKTDLNQLKRKSTEVLSSVQTELTPYWLLHRMHVWHLCIQCSVLEVTLTSNLHKSHDRKLFITCSGKICSDPLRAAQRDESILLSVFQWSVSKHAVTQRLHFSSQSTNVRMFLCTAMQLHTTERHFSPSTLRFMPPKTSGPMN